MTEPTPIPRLLPYALAYAKRGWPVFPLHTPTKSGACSCGRPCGNPGKHPRIRGGFKKATTDLDQIRAWWSQWPDANIGIATGERSGLLVVDVDPKNGGAGKWTQLTVEHDLPPLTVTVDTGSGGWHLYYQRPANHPRLRSKANAIKPGIDTRCDGGYVVAPPSAHVSGTHYTFRQGADPADTDLQPCPDWLFKQLYPEPTPPKQPSLPSSSEDGWLLTAFKAAGLFKRELGPDRAAVRCPWESEHSNPSSDQDSSTVVFRPTAGRTLGHFHCSHAHCVDRTLADVRTVLPAMATDAANRAYPPKQQPQPEQAPADTDDWQTELLLRTNKDLDACVPNIVSILSHDSAWVGVLAYDEFAGRAFFRLPPPWYADDAPATPHRELEDSDDVRLVSWLHRRYGLRTTKQVAHDALDIVALRNGFHPVREYLRSLEWDGVQRLPTFASTYLGADPNAPHYAHAPLRWFIAAVRRVFEPGCQCDSVLVLEGSQGLGKSRALRTLATDPWFADEIGDPSSKDAADALRGKWLIEIGELRWRKSDEDTRKAFITRRIDHYRPAYARRAVDIPRQCVLAASTNSHDWQTDPTGARRYWVVQCRAIDQAALERDRDQLWAEARTRYECGEPSWLQEDEVPAQKEALEQRREVDPWEDKVLEWLGLRTEVTVRALLTDCIGLETARQTKREANRVGQILRANGWEQTRTQRINCQRVKLWERQTSNVAQSLGGSI